MKRITTTIALAALAVAASTTTAVAAPPDDPNCWGVVSAVDARDGGLGDHSSDQATPRSGLGNLTRELGLNHISELGEFLGDCGE